MKSLGPYELNQVYAGDAKDLLAKLPEGCIDLTVTSPPYDDLRTYKGFVFAFEPIAAELFRVTKPGGVIIWIVGDATINGSETGTSFRQALEFMGLGLKLHDTMIYDRNSFRFPSPNRYHQVFEYMFVFSKGLPSTASLIQDRKNVWEDTRKQHRKREANGTFTIRQGQRWRRVGIRYNIWRYAVGRGNSTKDDFAFAHPAIFPEGLARDHILSWSNPGDLVLDPLCGSGTTLKMAKQLNRKWLGFDISPEYVRLAQKRVSQAQPPLFVMG